MNRQALAAYLTDAYGTAGEHLLPGWHMNKAHWLTVALDGTVEDEKIKFLVDMSYELTKK